MSIKKEQGEERKFSTGAKRQHAEGKGTPVLFPGDAYLDVCKHFEDGAIRYDSRNWEKGMPLSEFINSLERHIAQEKMGLTDESHDRAIAWNAICYLATKLRIKAGVLPKELDDLCGVYGKSVEPEVDDAVDIKIRKAEFNNYYYIVRKRRYINEYLWRDLKFHRNCCDTNPDPEIEGYFPSEEVAVQVLQDYLETR